MIRDFTPARQAVPPTTDCHQTARHPTTAGLYPVDNPDTATSGGKRESTLQPPVFGDLMRKLRNLASYLDDYKSAGRIRFELPNDSQGPHHSDD